MQDQRRGMPSGPVSPSSQNPYIGLEDNRSQALPSWAPEYLMAPFATNPFQPSYDSNLNSFNYGPHHIPTPFYPAGQLDSGYQSYGPAPDSSTFGAYSTAALAPNFAYDQQLNPPNPGLAPPWDVPAMQLPITAFALPCSTVNEQSNFPPTEDLEFRGWDQPGLASPPAGTSSLATAHRAGNVSSWLDTAFRPSPVDTTSANDVECVTTCPASSIIAGAIE